MMNKIKKAPIKYDSSIPITKEGKHVLSKMLERDPDNRLQLLDFMDMDYHKWDDEQMQEKVAEVLAMS